LDQVVDSASQFLSLESLIFQQRSVGRQPFVEKEFKRLLTDPPNKRRPIRKNWDLAEAAMYLGTGFMVNNEDKW